MMEQVSSPRELYTMVKHLVRKGARGVLLSGGFSREGHLPIEPYLGTIRDIKKDFGIVISVHTGIVTRELASKLREAGVDIVDYEIQFDPLVIKKLKHLDREPIDFIRSFEFLVKHGPPYIAPHVPVGFRYGRLLFEWSTVDFLRDYSPYITIFIVFIPTRNTSMENTSPPKASDVVELISYARRILGPRTILSLGCMRPWSIKSVLDKVLVEQQVVDRIVNPPKRIIMDYRLEIVESCCSVPEELLSRLYT